ncbi:class I SAM-dependent methyltransferase [Plantactinospora solaniradicis]|uniref:Class I SAM-dependent methyltransferase n=1 Tax=Plantactinospora solaniradicis TaxID=1723736 RepID=A0ABW1K966_9ACTN
MSSLVAAEQCTLCGGTRSEPALGGVLRRCRSCAFQWTAAELASPEELYDESYYKSESYRRYFALAAQWRFEATRRLRWLLSAVRPATLVEAGPAGGFFLKAASARGISVEGVEVSELAARYARERLGVPVRRGMFESISLAAPVQAVCAFHVLEHVPDPRVFLSAAREMLLPGGWLALEVPNISSAAAHRYGASWVDLAPRYHHWHFSPESLARLVTEAGFAVVHADTIFASHYLRPSRWPSRWGMASHWRCLRTTGSLRTTHPHLGDYLRLLARRQRPGGRA